MLKALCHRTDGRKPQERRIRCNPTGESVLFRSVGYGADKMMAISELWGQIANWRVRLDYPLTDCFFRAGALGSPQVFVGSVSPPGCPRDDEGREQVYNEACWLDSNKR